MLKEIVTINVFLASLLVVLLLPDHKIDKELQPSYQHFMDVASEACPNIKDKFPPKYYVKVFKRSEEFDPIFIGRCNFLPFTFEVIIDENYINSNQLDQLLAHELIHCVFRQMHNNRFKDLMHPIIQLELSPSLDDQIRYYAKKNC